MFHYEPIVHSIKFIVNCISSFKYFSVRNIFNGFVLNYKIICAKTYFYIRYLNKKGL